jgi:alanyl-tRNA synthetase
MLTGSEIRRKFLDFFAEKGHKIVHSSSLVPQNDPTLLFTNAGMNQFKDVFLGLEKRDYSRATTSQKCVRAGGKHNDLENVGFTNRHHTFFEMLGNFSFGDYFKKDAIAYAWELITSPEWFGIAKDKLYVTVFGGEPLASGIPGGIPADDEAKKYWLDLGVSEDRIRAWGMKDNFWQMGDTGPCGPCSEIHYDMGPAASDQGHTDCKFGCDCGRYVEIWNLVFMQFDRHIFFACKDHPQSRIEEYAFKCAVEGPHKSPDGMAVPNGQFRLDPLPKPCVDTGAGLERLASVLQGVISNYETDLFTPLLDRAAELITGKTVQHGLETISIFTERHGQQEITYDNSALRVIADHARAATFLVSDGVVPGNGKREYVLRRILRRGIYYGMMLRKEEPFMYQMADAVIALMKNAYPELVEHAARTRDIILEEEKRFARTLSKGLPILEREILSPVSVERVRSVVKEHKQQLHQRVLSEIDASNMDLAMAGAPPEAREVDDFHIKLGNLDVQSSQLEWSSLYFRSLIKDVLPRSDWPKFSGEQAFHLYETYGLPRDFIEDVLLGNTFILDAEEFEQARGEEQARARASWKGAAKQTANPAYQQLPKSEFEGYRQTRSENCEVLALLRGQGQGFIKPGNIGEVVGVGELNVGDVGEVILDHTPFYAESGGQVGDLGRFIDSQGDTVAEVATCYAPVQGLRAHQVIVKQPMRIGDKVIAVVNADLREATMRNHTATHLLHAGLREVLGKHVKQAGSLVAPNHLRFDFTHFTGVEDEELQDIEDLINREVLRNRKVETIENVPIDVAINEYKAIALFGEKYGDVVRVCRIGDFSVELCGGTHTAATGEIGLIKILKEGSVSSGVRRVEAVTGEESLAHFRKDHELEHVVSAFVSPTLAQKAHKDGAPSSESVPNSEAAYSPAEALKAELEKKDAEIKRLTRELDQARMKSAASSTANLGDRIKEIKGVKVLAHRVDNLDRPQMRTLVDQLRDKLGSGVVVLGGASKGNVVLYVGITGDVTKRIQAHKVIGKIAEKVGGKGGGRPDLAEAGGKDASALDAALDGAYSVVERILT